jgi:hypothetical protein
LFKRRGGGERKGREEGWRGGKEREDWREGGVDAGEIIRERGGDGRIRRGGGRGGGEVIEK